jgi:hypothetical protein
MRTLFIASLIAIAPSFALAQASKDQPKPPTQNTDKELVERLRADGAAGGTAPVPAEKRKAVGAGAGPHRHKTTPSPSKLPRGEPVEPPK